MTDALLKDFASFAVDARSREALLRVKRSDLKLLDLVQTPVLFITEGTVSWVNSALCALFDASADQFINRTIETLFVNNSRVQLQGWLDSEEYDSGQSLRIDLQIIGTENRPRWVNVRLVPCLLGKQHTLALFMADIEDKRRNRQVEEQLQQAQKMEAVGRLAGGVAHDMNNMLGAIMGFASVMQSEMGPDDPASGDLMQILTACRKGRDLMLNLLGFARRGKYRLEQFSIDDRIDDVINLLKHSIPKKIRIRKIIRRRGILIHGDSSQIHHALMNICLNAVDSMGETGSLLLEVDTDYVDSCDSPDCAYADLEKGEYLRVTVSDTGSGMAPEIMDMAFEPFFTTKPVGQGSGLGLPMVYGTVKNHGGAVILKSRPKQGTIVTMLLPISRNHSSTIPPPVERRTPSELQKPTILLVDDEEMIRQAGKRLLSKLGYRVLVAGDGKEGLRVFVEQRHQISAVMLDLMMPVMDGEETLMKMKEIEPSIPVLLSSGYSKEEKAEQLIASGADGFIQKPFDMCTLRLRLNSLLD